MGSLKPGEKAKRDTQRLSSTVPNDYNHLNVPGSLNFPLDHPRSRRPHARRRRGGLPAWMKALLAMAGVMFALGVVALVIFAIAFPPFFRGLEPRYQQRLIDMFPPFESLRATVPFEVLPTLSGASDSEAAQQLLLTQEEPGVAGTPQPGAGGSGLTDPGSDALPETPPAASPGYIPSPTPTESAGGIPVGALPTQEPTPLPVYEAPQVAALPTFTPQVLPTEVPLPATVKLGNIRYEEQGWNNCGPTTMTMALSYYGWTDNQTTAANWMKPHPEDKNVSPWQMVRFVNERTGVKALYRYGGTLTVLKRLLAAGFPVVVEESIQPAGEGWLGHYVLFIGYDDYQQHFLTFDSYLGSNKGQGRPSPYSVFDEKWRHFNRVFMVVYEPTREMELRRALGDYVDPAHGYRTALAQARDEATKNRDDKWAWFNMGTSYTLLGEYENAAFAYDEALRQGLPPRMLWYQFGLYEAYYYTGRYNDVLAHAQNTARYTPYVEESYYWEGMVYAAQGNQQAALEKFDQVLRFNRNFFPALEAKSQVEAGTFTVALSR